MKIIFGDATELTVQAVQPEGDYIRILTVGNTPEQLRVLFSDAVRTQKMTVQERGQTVATYEGYTSYQWSEVRPGKIYAAVMYKPEKTPEVQAEVQQAAITVAQIQAQDLTDEQAVQVRAIYPQWEKVIGKEVDHGFKFNYGEYLYKVITPEKMTIEAQWIPGEGTGSIYTAINETNAGTLEDLIPVPDTVEQAGFEYEKGKYYLEGETVYQMIWSGIQEGEKLTLYFPPSKLEAYFQAVETE